MLYTQQQRDVDFLLEFREFKGVVNTKLDRAISDINDLKEGTAVKSANHEVRLNEQCTLIGEIEQKQKDSRIYMNIIMCLGVLILGIIIWKLTGYHI